MIKNSPITFIILAAGRGSRMNSSVPKVMHKIGGMPLIGHILSTIHTLNYQITTCAVLSPELPQITEYCRLQNPNIKIAYQYHQLGTADAVRASESLVHNIDCGHVIIMAGDTPLVKAATLQTMINKLNDTDDQTAALVLAMRVTIPNTYGRLITNNQNELEQIIETKDASITEQAIDLCNSGIIAIKRQYLFKYLKLIKPSSVTQEFYLTDIIGVMRSHNLKVSIIETDSSEVQGINTQCDLAMVENTFQNGMRHRAMVSGVTLLDPSSVYFSHDTNIAGGVIVHPHAVFGPNVQIDSDVEILSFSHIEGARIKSRAKVGPFARIRSGSIIDENTRVGNFVEIKNTHLGAASKAGHLAYLGDSVIGKNCNIGAGTITVNYDGVNKWQTYIKDNVFVGSNSSLIAPVTINEGAMIAAGSTITKNVTCNALALGRSRQIELKEGAGKMRQKILKRNTNLK